jgi:hypothetical protein
MAKKMTTAQFEKTAVDKRMDKAGAKKAGVSVKQWENSAADKKADAAAMKKMALKKGGLAKKGGK